MSAVEEAEQAYNALTPEQQQKVTNAIDIADHKATITAYEAV